MADDAKDDHLSLANNASVISMLKKLGDGKEVVKFSDFVIKINRRDKEQTRVLLVTNLALYNLLPNDYGKCKRRIEIAKITAITASKPTDEFVIHVPDEYDYRYKSIKKQRICKILKHCFKDIHSPSDSTDLTFTEPQKLVVTFIDQPDLKDMALTKAMARLQTREDRLRRKMALLAEAHDSDDEELNADEKKDKVTSLNPDQKVRLEDFELLKVLGRGSFGKVMQVRKKDDGKIYAMKILKKKSIVERNQVEHTKAERKILEQTQDHPFLMSMRYAFQSKEKLYFVLDYYQGGELFFHLKFKRRFPEDVARFYVAEIAMALGYLHSKNMIYRDLKPENILLDDNGHVCLTDFGLSKDVGPDEEAHTFCGTPEYLAPEIVTGAGHGKAVDWWSLGILLYELTVGIPPFYSQNVNEMYSKIQHGVLRFPPFLTDECKQLIVALLNRDPKKRLGSGADDVEDIKAHDFFKNLDWDRLMRKDYDVGYKPRVKNTSDTSNFDDTFTSEPVVDSMAPESQLSKTVDQQSNFSGFTFIPQDDNPNNLAGGDSDDDN